MNILFIGNSHTYFNSLPYQVREMLRLHEPRSGVAMCAAPGVTLGWHAEQPETQMAILYHERDCIVLQQKSHPFDGSEALLGDCRALLPYLRRSRARVLLFVTWAEKQYPENQAAIDEAFRRVAQELGAAIVPVSTAWQAILRSAPEIELYDADGEHASPAGSYLAACTFYAALLGRSPAGLPGRITVNGDVLADLPADQAARLQAAAWRAVQGVSPATRREPAP